MPFSVTALYAALIALLVIIVANIVTMRRVRAGISILHGDDLDLALWIRRHANLVENAPLVLLLMLLCEARGLPAAALHAMGLALLAARLAHLRGLSVTDIRAPLRIIGGGVTQLVMLAAIIWLGWSLL